MVWKLVSVFLESLFLQYYAVLKYVKTSVMDIGQSGMGWKLVSVFLESLLLLTLPYNVLKPRYGLYHRVINFIEDKATQIVFG